MDRVSGIDLIEHRSARTMIEPIPHRESTAPSKALRVRLPGFIKEEEVGFGEVVKRATYAFGFRPCGGCQARAAALNRWMVFVR
jgi:hypothetical protein